MCVNNDGLAIELYAIISVQTFLKDTSVIYGIHGESGVGESSKPTSVEPHLERVIL